MASRPTLFQIIKTDQLALFAAMFSPVCLVMAGLAGAGWLPKLRGALRGGGGLVSPESAPIFLALSAVTLVVGVLLLRRRADAIRTALAGRAVEAKITKFTKFKDRGYLHYRYAVDGQEIETRHFVHLSAAAKRLQEGQSVTVGVDPNMPEKGFVVELFQG